jgi:hypothetical protein
MRTGPKAEQPWLWRQKSRPISRPPGENLRVVAPQADSLLFAIATSAINGIVSLVTTKKQL